MPVYACVADALSVLTRHDDVVHELILPVPGAARRARDIVTEACARWDFPRLTAHAALIVTELVTSGGPRGHRHDLAGETPTALSVPRRVRRRPRPAGAP
jgi:hypothetical protein